MWGIAGGRLGENLFSVHVHSVPSTLPQCLVFCVTLLACNVHTYTVFLCCYAVHVRVHVHVHVVTLISEGSLYALLCKACMQ